MYTRYQSSCQKLAWLAVVAAANFSLASPSVSVAADCAAKTVGVGQGTAIPAGCGKLNIAFLTMGTNNTSTLPSRSWGV
jgi:hypothetical protein